MMIHFEYSTKILYKELEEEIYIDCPQDISDIGKDDYIILNECI